MLAREAGMYVDLYDLYGRLAFDAFFAARLVVDTGMNYFGWSRELGPRFDIRRFHDAVIGSGGFPLFVLRRHIEWWVEQERAGAPTAEFRSWVATHGHPVRLADADTAADRLGDLSPLRAVVGNARVLALSEPFHGGHEPLLFRNRVARWCVVALRCTAIALETGLAPSKLLDDYVRGRTAHGAVSDSALAAAFNYGFGALQENLDLLHWLRAYNAGKPQRERVGFYGIDLTAAGFLPTSQSLDAVLAYLDRADPALGRAVRAGDRTLAARVRGDTFPEMAPAERDRVTGRIIDLVSLMRARRLSFINATGPADYEWALRQAVNAEQDLMFLRRMPRGLLPRLMAGLDAITPQDSVKESNELREVAMADNLAWVLEQQPPNGRVLLFAHFSHLQGMPLSIDDPRPAAKLVEGLEVAGQYMRALLGAKFVLVGTYFGQAAHGDPALPSALPPDSAGIEGLLAAPGLAGYLLDLRAIPKGALLDFLGRDQLRRGGSVGDMRIKGRPTLASDALLYIDRITPAHPTKR